ncbi:MAG TPA: GNAT family N-acetyltransferase, partial [Aggregatilineales bacterium]|nr:GNAT family N-acetyltransferase [Aggregatilineales bacterium]
NQGYVSAREEFHRNWSGLFEVLPRYAPAARCWREPGALVGISGWAIGAFNTAILDDEHALTAQTLERMTTQFTMIGLPYSLMVCSPLTVPDCDELMQDQGYSRWFADPLLWREGPIVAPPADPRITIVPVNDADGLAVYSALVHKVFDLPTVIGDSYLEIMWRMPNSQQVIANWDGNPVGVGMLLLCNGTAAIYELGTLPIARRRGVGSTLCAALHQMALAAGYRGTVLASSAMGLPIYSKLGYQHDGYQVAYSR